MKKKRALFLLLVFLMAFLAGCGEQVKKPEKIKDLEYTVQEESQVPEELLAKMKEGVMARRKPVVTVFGFRNFMRLQKALCSLQSFWVPERKKRYFKWKLTLTLW